MKSVMCLVSLVIVPVAAAVEPADSTLRVRAALALAFAVPDRPPGYPEQYAAAVVGGKPLVVFVGQPGRELAGCACMRVESFPAAASEAVVLGLPEGGGLRRVDLPGRPADTVIRAVIGFPGASSALLPAGGCDPKTGCVRGGP